MTPKDLNSKEEACVILISVNLKTNKIMWEEHDDIQIAKAFMDDYKKDFPDWFHFMVSNKEAKRIWAKKMFDYDLDINE